MTDDALAPVWLSLRVGVLALAVTAPLGIGLAWLQASRAHRFRGLVDALVLAPMVLPPSVIGFFLVWGLGRRGPVGGWLERAGVRLIFTPWAAVIASSIVALPVLVKAAQPAMEAVPQELVLVARTLGLAPFEVFRRVVLRGAWRGVATGLLLAFVRAIGEFGATLMFAGNIPGRTDTMPIAIWGAYQAGNDDRALGYVAVLTVLGFLAAAFAARFAPPRGVDR
ncbi:MAG: molybdate ABC transporter permease subunit [Deltaproteobacteria bacterium]|nr:molybdate ABC transporter permease subunit [Deltaproteobacteria bacterium]